VGLRVVVEGVEGKLKDVHGMKKERVCFVFQPDDPHQVYLLLEVPQQYVQLPWHWRVWLKV
jgi:hypothetical protein